jgi:hypothetical protein
MQGPKLQLGIANNGHLRYGKIGCLRQRDN